MLIAMKGISYNEGIKKEWIATNGIGGYASSTIIHANTRGYHGLLVASLQPPIDRHLLLSKLDESITVGGKTYDISTNKFGDLITPRGYNHIVQFRLDPFPTFLYDVDGVMLEKSVFMIHGQNATIVSYAMLRGACEISINVLANSRDFHSRTMGRLEFVENESTKATTLKHGLTALVIGSDKGKYEKLGIWYDGLTYDAERERGLPDRENCYVSGRFVASLCEGEKLNILATGGYEKIAVKTFAKFYSTKPENFDALLQEEKERLQYLLHTFSKRELPKKEMIEQLVLSSDAFIVERKSTNSKSIIAGYHWFGDWGRDTLISLTGLTLVTGRFNDAKSILKTFASYMKNGLVPNTFPEHGIEPIYNTADASLLFSLALYDYYQYTKDISLIRELLPKLEEVVDCYTNGTDFGIGVDSDMLVRLSNPNIQLTWMDAKIGDRIVTPRNGKPVEINAFWYATLMVLGKFYEILKIQKDVEDKAETVKRSFQKFWNSDANYLFDTIDPHDPSIRPNALFALSIPFRLLDEEKEAKIIEKAYEELYTPYGIRTLSPKDPRYHGSYTGDPVSRDEAYHQGTAWPYLLRPFITSYCRIRRLTLADAFNKFFIPFEQHLADAGVGFISEIFDGDSPNPRGCIAQAWSVAELLRAYAEIAGLSNEHRG